VPAFPGHLPQGLPAQSLAVRIDFQAGTQAVAERRSLRPTRRRVRPEMPGGFPAAHHRAAEFDRALPNGSPPEAGSAGLQAAEPHPLYGHPNAMRQAIHSALF